MARKDGRKSVKERRKEREKLEARGIKFVMQPLEEQQHLNSLSDEEYFDWFEQEEQEIQQTIADPFWRRDSRPAEDYIKQGYELVLKDGLRIWRKKASRDTDEEQ
jgi:hypothetical protein